MACYFVDDALSEVAHIEPFETLLEKEDATIKEKLLIFIILNGTDAGGFNNFIKEADLTDGMMDILLIKNCSHVELAIFFFKVLSKEYINDKYVIKLKARKCKIEANKSIDVSIDGEKGPKLPIDIRFIHKGLSVFR